MVETIRKILDCEVKKLEGRTYEFTASTSAQDRDGEVIEALGWDLGNFKKNPVIMYAHDYRTLPIGRAPRVWVSKDGELKNTVEFPPEGTYEFADIVERLVDTGYLKTESVGFLPRKWEDGDGEKSPRRTYTKQELLEISIVPVPSNPDALRNAIEDGIITTKEFEALQSDSIIEMGAGIVQKPEPEVTEEYIRIRVRNPDDFQKDSFRTIDIDKGKGIKAVIGRLKGETTTTTQSFLFDKDKWTVAEAQKWVEEHKGIDESAIERIETEAIHWGKGISQAEIIDELDYLLRLLDTEGMNEDVERDAWGLVREIMRLSGSDIPVDILEKVGAVLNSKNKQRLKDAQNLIQSVIDSAGEPEPEKEISQAETAQTIAQMVAKAVKEEIDRLQGKVL